MKLWKIQKMHNQIKTLYILLIMIPLLLITNRQARLNTWKRRLQEQFANGNPSTTSAVNNTVLLNTSQNVQDDIIDIDDDDTTTSSETANNNLNTNNNDNNSNITLNTRASISSTINDRNSTNDNKNFVSNW